MGAVSRQPVEQLVERADIGVGSDDEVSSDADALRAVYGSRWVLIPHGYGHASAQARDVLGHGLVPIDIDSSDPTRVVHEVGEFARLTTKMMVKLLDETVFVGEAFAIEAAELPLRHLRRLCHAIVRLSTAPPFPVTWAAPAATKTAACVLGALGDDLRTLADLRRGLNDEFTDAIWTVSGRRRTARRELTAVTRSGRPATNPKRALGMLRHARALNETVAASWSTATGHLGHFAASSLPDVDGANEALSGVTDIHRALGDSLDEDALRALAAADAFVADELLKPARAITTVIDAWELRANRFGGFDPTRHTAAQLWAWSLDVDEGLATLAKLKDVTSPLRANVRSAGHILEDAIRRDRIHRFCEAASEAISA